MSKEIRSEPLQLTDDLEIVSARIIQESTGVMPRLIIEVRVPFANRAQKPLTFSTTHIHTETLESYPKGNRVISKEAPTTTDSRTEVFTIVRNVYFAIPEFHVHLTVQLSEKRQGHGVLIYSEMIAKHYAKRE